MGGKKQRKKRIRTERKKVERKKVERKQTETVTKENQKQDRKNKEDEWRRVKTKQDLLNAPIPTVVAQVQHNATVTWSLPILDMQKKLVG